MFYGSDVVLTKKGLEFFEVTISINSFIIIVIKLECL